MAMQFITAAAQNSNLHRVENNLESLCYSLCCDIMMSLCGGEVKSWRNFLPCLEREKDGSCCGYAHLTQVVNGLSESMCQKSRKYDEDSGREIFLAFTNSRWFSRRDKYFPIHYANLKKYTNVKFHLCTFCLLSISTPKITTWRHRQRHMMMHRWRCQIGLT